MDNLHNIKVRLNTREILARAQRTGYYTGTYIDFVKSNQDTVFTAILENGYTEMYTFKENKTWLFHKDDLIPVIHK